MKIMLAVFAAAILIQDAEAARRHAASCAPADVQAAVDAAVAGDTVILPACREAWYTTLAIFKPVTLRGQGVNETILERTTDAPLVMIKAVNVTGFKLRDLTLIGTHDIAPNVHQDYGLMLINAVDFRIYDAAFEHLAVGIQAHGDPLKIRGVIYDNEFTDIYYREPTGGALGYGVWVQGNGTWPTLELGTAQNVFIEDNIFTRNRHTIASNNGSRYVFRYNRIVDNREDAAAIDAHGRGPWWPRGSRQWEVYRNTITNAVPRYAGLGMRGGDGVAFSNRFSSNVTFEILLTNEGGCAGVYPLSDQIRDVSIWSNTLTNGSPAPIFIQAGCQDHIKLGRDYFTTKRPGYMPYPYPHPAR